MNIGIADLAGVRAKISRAKEHQNALKTEFDIWARQEAGSSKFKIWRDGDWDVVTIDPIPQPDIRFPVIVGDIIHNLRSSLDHLVWQLVLRDGHKPSRRNQFPIYTSKQKFFKEVKLRRNKPKNNELNGITVDGDAWTIIEEAQPYTNKYQFIGVLGRLSNMDKHKTVYVQIPFVDNISEAICWNDGAVLLNQRQGSINISCEKPTEIVRYQFDKDPDPNIQVKGKLTVNPTFGEGPIVGGSQLSIGTFITLINEVTAIVDEVSRLPRVINS